MATLQEINDLITASPDLTIEDRIAVIRTLRVTIPDLVVPERRLKGRIDSAWGVRPEYIDSTILGLENSDLWQQSASTSPKELRHHRSLSAAYRLLFEEAQALCDVADDNARYHHFAGVDKARAAHRVGQQITGDAAILVKPHLEIMATTRPIRGRSRVKPATLSRPSDKE